MKVLEVRRQLGVGERKLLVRHHGAVGSMHSVHQVVRFVHHHHRALQPQPQRLAHLLSRRTPATT